MRNINVNQNKNDGNKLISRILLYFVKNGVYIKKEQNCSIKYVFEQ